MAPSIRTMRLMSNGAGSAMTEILVADNADERLAVESLRIRLRIPLRDIDVCKAENAAMQRAGRICEDIERGLADGRISRKILTQGLPRQTDEPVRCDHMCLNAANQLSNSSLSGAMHAAQFHLHDLP
jgi:hypothetical protein